MDAVTSGRRSVTVGVDGIRTTLEAVSWAAAEARLWGLTAPAVAGSRSWSLDHPHDPAELR